MLDVPATPDITAALAAAARRLAPVSDSPRLDAELLLAAALGIPRTALRVQGAASLPEARGRDFERLLLRRLGGEPVAYLLGVREFWSLEFEVNADVLVPRPETELLVERALERLPPHAPCTVLDLGTGSGAIALALASERPTWRIIGVDVSERALAVARRNAGKLGIAGVEWRLGSWFGAVPADRFDLVIANPPYIAAADPALPALAAEPALALCAGVTGLEALTAIIGAAPAHLAERGRLLLEHGSNQASEVSRLMRLRGFDRVRSHRDYAGRERITEGVAATPDHSPFQELS